MSSYFQPLSFKGYVGYIEKVWASVRVSLVSDSKNLSPWPEETVIDPQETVCKCVCVCLKWLFTSQWMTEMSKCCSLLPHSPSGWPPLQGWPNLASVLPGNHPKIRWNCNIFNCFDKDVRTSTTSCSALNWLHFCNKLLINTIRIFFNAFLTVVALTTNFQLAHKYFHLSLLHALCLLEPQTSLKNHAHLFLLHEVQLHHVLPYPQPSVLIAVIIKHTVPNSFSLILGRQWKHEDPWNLGPWIFVSIDIRCNGDDATKISCLSLKTRIFQM